MLKHTHVCIQYSNPFLLFVIVNLFLSGDLPKLRPPLSASVEKESLQQYVVVSYCTCGVSDHLLQKPLLKLTQSHSDTIQTVTISCLNTTFTFLVDLGSLNNVRFHLLRATPQHLTLDRWIICDLTISYFN